MRRKGVGNLLLEAAAGSRSVIFQCQGRIVFQIGQAQMQIPVHRNMKGITGLVGVHDMALMMQAFLRSLHIVEGEVHIVGTVCKDLFQVGLQRRCHSNFCLQTELRFQLRGDIGRQPELVIHRQVPVTVRHILVYKPAGGQGKEKKKDEYGFSYSKKHFPLPT